MSLSPDKKQELREMSRMEASRVISEVLEIYRTRKENGRITVDVRNGKAIWVKPVIAEVDVTRGLSDEECVIRGFHRVLREFQIQGASGTIVLTVYRGRVVDIEKFVELKKVRIG